MKKNILYISPNFNLACGVSKHVFTLLTSDELKKYYNLSFITNGGDALKKLDNAGIDYSLINFRTDKILHFDFFKSLKQIKKYCEEKEIDIIHSHHRYPEYLSNRIKEHLGMKTVVTVHNFVTGLKRFSYKSDFIIAISSAIKNHLNRYFEIDLRKIKVLYNCLNQLNSDKKKYENVREFLGIPSAHFLILYAGRIVKEKGIETLIRSFNILTKSSDKIVLVIVGTDEYSKSFSPFRSKNEKIIYLKATENLEELYEISDLLILPTYKEGLGYSMLEAGLFKIPFIGSRTGGIAEFIADGINGYLFEPGNSQDLTNKISYVLTHPNETADAAKKLHEKVLRECNCEKYFEKLTDIYSSLLKN